MSMLQLALNSIESGLQTGAPMTITRHKYLEELYEIRSCFVTLKQDSVLRGCIGSLDARKPLIEDVAANAFAAANEDIRFQKLSRDELDVINIGISVLGPSEALTFDSQQMLLDILHPGQDGLILKDGNAKSTFLPAVWKSLPAATDFLGQLKQKAGLPANYWSESLEIWRYTTEAFNASVTEIRNLNEGSIRNE